MSRASEYRKSRAVEIALPSGARFLLRRPSLQAWLNNGRMPQFFSKLAVDAANKAGDATAAVQAIAALTEAETQALFQFQLDVVRFSMVSPSLILTNPAGELSDDQLLLDELDPDDFNAIFEYAMNGSPKNPVAAKPEDTTVAAVKSFRDGASGQLPAATGADVQADGGATITAVRTA